MCSDRQVGTGGHRPDATNRWYHRFLASCTRAIGGNRHGHAYPPPVPRRRRQGGGRGRCLLDVPTGDRQGTRHPGHDAVGHHRRRRARGDPHAGEPLVRPLPRHAGRGPRLRGPLHDPAAGRPPRLGPERRRTHRGALPPRQHTGERPARRRHAAHAGPTPTARGTEGGCRSGRASRTTTPWATTSRPRCRSSSRWPTRSPCATPTTARSRPVPTPTDCSCGPEPTARRALTSPPSSTSGTASTTRQPATRGPRTRSACSRPA